MNRVSIDSLSEAERKLIDAAARAAASAYCPYSRFSVGAAVLTESGGVYTGANVENASYGLGTCAEVCAIGAATRAEGGAHPVRVKTIAIVGGPELDLGSNPRAVTPCGRCRQVIHEAGNAGRTVVTVLSCSGDKRTVLRAAIEELLPEAFDAPELRS